MNSPVQLFPCSSGKATQTSATKCFQSTLDPVKPLILNVSVEESSLGDYLYEDINPCFVARPIKEVALATVEATEETVNSHKNFPA